MFLSTSRVIQRMSAQPWQTGAFGASAASRPLLPANDLCFSHKRDSKGLGSALRAELLAQDDKT